jgi:phosphohistidine phosphatase
MKTVFLVRHAKSSWKDASLDDIDRPLNKRGIRDAPFMAKLLKGRGVVPDRLFSSTAKRAQTTAEFFADQLEIPKSEIELREEIYEAFPEDLLDFIRTLPDNISTVLIFGHNPAFTTLANQFSQEYIANIPTCGIVRIESEADRWKQFSKKTGKLTAFYYPKQYFS